MGKTEAVSKIIMDLKRVINFGPGPAKIPESVLKRAQDEMLDFANTGHSVLEMSHRSAEFSNVLKSTEQLIRDLMMVPKDYEILMLQGGGSGQFAAVPLNLMGFSKGQKPSANYVVTGTWSAKAAKEAEKYLIVHKAINPPLHHYTRIPESSHWSYDPNAAYMYYCANETIHGVEFSQIPDSKGIPLVGDVSSNILTKHIDVSKHGILFGGTQKNLGSAGLTMCIVRKDLIGFAHKMCPSIFNYKEQHQTGSVFNTPPVFSIYLTKMVLEWIRDEGGVKEMERRNSIKAQLIYDVIEDSKGFYHCPVHHNDRSRMNIPFRIGSHQGVPELEKAFLTGAEAHGMISLKGHRSVGGVRASLYNAVTVEDVETLADYMKEFYDLHQIEQ